MRYVVLVVAAAIALTACGSNDHKSTEKACRSAMAKQLDGAVNDSKDAREGYRPRACDGLDNETVQKIAEDLIAKKFG